MSRYLILIVLNAPFAVASIINAVISYKLKKLSKNRLLVRIVLWSAVISGLVFAEPVYTYLFSRGLTQTESLSLFDVMQITGIVIVLFANSRNHAKIDTLERRMRLLHQELSIKISDSKQ